MNMISYLLDISTMLSSTSVLSSTSNIVFIFYLVCYFSCIINGSIILTKLETVFILNFSFFLSLTSSNNAYYNDSTKHVLITLYIQALKSVFHVNYFM